MSRLRLAGLASSLWFLSILLSFPAHAGAQSFTIGQNFTGSSLAQSGFIPPDTMGAVGPNHIVELINGRYATYNKSGTFISGTSLDQFWVNSGVTPSGSFSFDPRVIYDKSSGRWFATSVDNGGAANNFLVAVSNSNDPTAGWTGFKIDSDSDNSHWADFPMMGINNQVVTVSANMFPLAGGTTTTSFLVLPKSDLLLGTPTVANGTLFQNVSGNDTGFSPQPIFDYDNGNLPLKILSSYNKSAGSLKTSSIGGTANAPTLVTAGGFIAVTSRNTPPNLDQPGTKPHIDSGSSRFGSNVVQQQILGRTNPSLFGVHAVDIGGRAALEWYEIDAVTNTLLQSGTISDPSLAFIYPSIAVNNFGDMVIGFSGGDPSNFIGSYLVVGETVAGTTTFSSPVLTQAGLAAYQNLDSNLRNRWGDYSATVVDPNNERHFWTFQEYVSATDVWSIRITQVIITIPEPASFGLLSVLGLVVVVSARRRRLR